MILGFSSGITGSVFLVGIHLILSLTEPSL
jgi:hypothetical protein